MDLTEWIASVGYTSEALETEAGARDLAGRLNQLIREHESLDLLESQWVTLLMFVPGLIAEYVSSSRISAEGKQDLIATLTDVAITILLHVRKYRFAVRNYLESFVRPLEDGFRLVDSEKPGFEAWVEIREQTFAQLDNAVRSGDLDLQMSALACVRFVGPKTAARLLRGWLPLLSDAEARGDCAQFLAYYEAP